MKINAVQERTSLSRRTFMKFSTGTTAALLLGAPRWAVAQSERSLPIPPLMTGAMQDGVVAYELIEGLGTMEFLPGQQTATWGYNGDYLGPTLVMRQGDQVALKVTNNIGVQSTTHWHGMHVPAVMDGGPHQRIEPGDLPERSPVGIVAAGDRQPVIVALAREDAVRGQVR